MVSTLVQALLVLAAMILPFPVLFKAIRGNRPACPVDWEALRTADVPGPLEEIAEAILHEAWSRDPDELEFLEVKMLPPSQRIRSLARARLVVTAVPGGPHPTGQAEAIAMPPRVAHLLAGHRPNTWHKRSRGHRNLVPSARQRTWWGARWRLPDPDRVFPSRRFIRFYEDVIDDLADHGHQDD